MSKVQDEYILEREIVDGNFHIRVFRPVLTEEERERRMKRIHDAAASLLKEVIRKESHEKKK